MIFDLTMPLNPDTPVYPGDPRVVLEPANTFDSAGCLDHALHLSTHSGTHIDAPAHMIEGGAMLNAFGVDRFVGRGVVVDIAGDGNLSLVQPEDIVLLKSGVSASSSAADYYNRDPGIPLEMAKRLISLGVKMVGVDAGSVDADPFPIHKTLLGADVLIIENLVGLHQLADLDRFQVVALPLHLNVEASPARVIAISMEAD